MPPNDEPQLDASKEHRVIHPLLQIIKEYGIFAAMAIFFIWQGDKREDALNSRIDQQQEFTNQKLLAAIEGNSQVMTAATIAINAVANQAKQNTATLKQVTKDISDNQNQEQSE